MKLSKRGEYALRALIDMGIAHELGRPLVQIGLLAEKERLPIKFLEQILMQLKDAGYVESKRGKLGGYLLLMPAKKIKIGQVIRLIDGPLAPVSCVSVTAYERCSCPDEEHCGLRMLMGNVRNAITDILDTFTLADTVDMTLKKVRRSKVAIPFIKGILTKPTTGSGRKSNGGRTAVAKQTGRQKPSVVSSKRKPELRAGSSSKLSRPKAGAKTLKPGNR